MISTKDINDHNDDVFNANVIDHDDDDDVDDDDDAFIMFILMSMIIATLTFLLITLHDDDDDYDDDNDDDDDYYDDDDDDEYLQHPAALDSSSLLGQSSCVSHSQDPGIHLKLEHLYSSGGQTRSLSANKATLVIFLVET